ncbi:MAG: L-2-hydroxyglutarate oxidase [Candidatus Dormiibacterota bacterium]
MTIPRHDVVVIGAGLVGLAAALRLTDRRPGLDIVLVDKEADVALHQSGHNSGVLHSGLYYAPGSLRARLCRAGRDQLIAFALDKQVEVRRLGKLVVALSNRELPSLEALMARGLANGLSGLERVGSADIRNRVVDGGGVAGLWVPETAIVDFRAVARALRTELEQRGVEFRLGTQVTGVRESSDGVVLRVAEGELRARRLVSCAGLQSDLIAAMAGHKASLKIFPFRGGYFRLSRQAAHRVKCLVYPVPDANLPFLGVHLTPNLCGAVFAGPNAVLALHREGYRRRDVSLRQLASMMNGREFFNLGRRYTATGVREIWRDLSIRSYARSLARYLPGIRADDLVPSAPGVRAQAVAPDGTLVEDFVLLTAESAVYVLNAPSPAATAALAIGELIATRVYPE